MKRFRPAKTVDEERDSVEAAVPSCTKYCTKWAYKIFEEWQMSRKNKVAIEEATALRFENLSSVQDLDSVKIEELSVESLNFWLSKFVQEVAKKNGERYPPRSIYSIVSGINRYLAEANPNNSVNILDKAERRLTLFRKVLDREMKDGTREGLSVKFKKAVREEVTAEEEELFWSKGLLGNETAECLLNTVYYYNGKLFGLRAKEHRQLRYINIRVENNFIIFDESVSKTFHGGLNDLKYKPRFVKHFCHALGSEHSRCLVEIYEMYLSKIQDLATKIDAFYFKPHRDPRVFDFEKVAIGINTLNKILPDKLCATAGLAKKTSHCLRVTCATNLFQNGVEEKIIRERTGHRSNALMRYEHPTEKQMVKASAALAPVGTKPKVINSDLPALEWDLPEITDEMLKEIEVCELEAQGKQGEFIGDIFPEIPMLESESVAEANTSNMSSLMRNPCFNSCSITFNVNVGSKK